MPRTVTTRNTRSHHVNRLRDATGLRPLASADGDRAAHCNGADLIARLHELGGMGRSDVRTEA